MNGLGPQENAGQQHRRCILRSFPGRSTKRHFRPQCPHGHFTADMRLDAGKPTKRCFETGNYHPLPRQRAVHFQPLLVVARAAKNRGHNPTVAMLCSFRPGNMKLGQHVVSCTSQTLENRRNTNGDGGNVNRAEHVEQSNTPLDVRVTSLSHFQARERLLFFHISRANKLFRHALGPRRAFDEAK